MFKFKIEKNANGFNTIGITNLGSNNARYIYRKALHSAWMLQNCTSQLLGNSKEDTRGVDEQCDLVLESEGAHRLAVEHFSDIVLAAVQAEVVQTDLDSFRSPTFPIVHHSDRKVASWGGGATPEFHVAGLKIDNHVKVTHLSRNRGYMHRLGDMKPLG